MGNYKHYVGEAGTDFILDTGIAIGTVQLQSIKYKNPAGVEGTWLADLYDSYSDLAGATGTYLLKHTLASTDLTVPGTWYFQAHIAAIDGTWNGETVELNIYDEFE